MVTTPKPVKGRAALRLTATTGAFVIAAALATPTQSFAVGRLAAKPAVEAVPGAGGSQSTPDRALALPAKKTPTATQSPTPEPTTADADGTLPKTGLLVPTTKLKRPAVTSAAWLMFDIDSGDILAAQNPRQFHPPASTIKTLTALTVLSKLEPDAEYTATREDAGIEGSKVGIIAGGKYTVTDLLHGLMMSSGNDAANALGNMFGSQSALVDAMNDYAKKLGATETTVGTPSGLDAEGQQTTVVDMAIIARAAMNNPTISKIAKTRLYTFPGKFDEEGNQTTFQVSNHNKILRYKEGIGLKTGFTQKSRHTYMGVMEKDGRRLGVTVLRGETRPWKQSGELMLWAYKLPSSVEPVGKLPAEIDLSKPTATSEPEETEAEPEATQTAEETALAIPESRPSGATQWIIAAIAVTVGVVIAALLRRHLMMSRRRKLYSISGAGGTAAGSKERGKPRNNPKE